MSGTTVATVWEFYDPKRHAGQGGNYMFLLKAFGNAPYYSGEAQDFANRFTEHSRSHRNLFAAGKRTFMRRPFIEESTDRSHAGFAGQWHHYKQQSAEKQQKLVWVPKDNADDNAMGSEGATFWANEVALLVSIRGDERHAVEKRVQVDIMDYYDGLLGQDIDWRLPERSRLVGHGPGVVTEPTLSYQLGDGQAGDARTFFGMLQRVETWRTLTH